ncbi:hypothetical protein [Sphaerisporangium sp. TRM90804]|uniref:hypothetical protein n=1 Tax=Sphaerisporangium sp. TRM90804 TaxID=3031113 RepID=UPI0024478A00|nr:hypothetical protein [Sphaerisporangium sp. TRM90804]MDH2427000.1 hypothetical protein [Sphaerisporangium sp. TRM90804]
MAMMARRFLLVTAGSALFFSGLFGLSALGELLSAMGNLPARVLRRALVFPGRGEALTPGTVAALVVFAVVLAVGMYAVLRWADVGWSWRGYVGSGALVGAPAGVLAVLVWALVRAGVEGAGEPEGSPASLFYGSLTYAPAWGVTMGALTGLVVWVWDPELPAGSERAARPFQARGWVLPSLVVGWALIWSVIATRLGPSGARDQPLLIPLRWLVIDDRHLGVLAVVVAAGVAGGVEALLRRRLPVEGRPGRAFVVAWIALCAAPPAYAAVTAIGDGMLDLYAAGPLNIGWVAEYAEDTGAALVSEPTRIAVPPLLLALVVTAIRLRLPARERVRAEPDPVRPDRRWALLVAGAAVLYTYFRIAVASLSPAPVRQAEIVDAPLLSRALFLLTPPSPPGDEAALLWFWSVAGTFLVLSALLGYAAVRGQTNRILPVGAYLTLLGGLALAAQLAWNGGGTIARALTDQRPPTSATVSEAAAFTAVYVPFCALVMLLVHVAVGFRVVRSVLDLGSLGEDEDFDRVWDKLTADYGVWKRKTAAFTPSRDELRLMSVKAAGIAVVVAVVAGAFQGFGVGRPVGQVTVPADGFFLALPSLPLVPGPQGADLHWVLEIITGMLYALSLGGLVWLGLRRLNVRERRLSAGLAVWGLSVVAGGLVMLVRALLEAALLDGGFGPGDLVEAYSGVGWQMGLLAGIPVAVGVMMRPGWAPRGPVLRYGAALTLAVAAAPLARLAQDDGQVAIATATWRVEHRDPQLTVDVRHPLVQGGDAGERGRIGAALSAPVRELVETTLEDYRRYPPRPTPEGGTHTTNSVTSRFTVVRDDSTVISIRYVSLVRTVGLRPREIGHAVDFDRAFGRTLTTRDVFTAAAFSRTGRERLAAALRPHLPPNLAASLGSVDVDDGLLQINLGRGAVEFTFGRPYFCNACETFTVRMPPERLPGLLRRSR